MANLRIIFAVLFFLSLLGAVFFWASSTVKQDRIDDAEEMSATIHAYLRLVGERCRARSPDFTGTTECLELLVEELEEVDNVEEEEFEKFDTETNESGYLIIVNEGRKPLESAKFKLLHNRRVVDEGCAIPGSIDQGYACKLFFDSPCEPGDVLEVKYGEERAYLRTC